MHVADRVPNAERTPSSVLAFNVNMSARAQFQYARVCLPMVHTP